jgi:hypothetical protein
VDSSQEQAVKRKFESLPSEQSEAWDKFVSTSLTEINKRMQTPLVNELPSNTFEEDVARQENALHQAFVEYQMQQMTRNLCTQIGSFNTTEFTELDDVPIQPQVDQLSRINFSLDAQLNQSKSADPFDQIVYDRDVRPGTDSNSSDDEDLWEEKEAGEMSLFDIQSFKNERSNKPIEHADAGEDVKMEVDQQADPWANSGSSNNVAIPMDAGDPWGNDQSNNPEPAVVSGRDNDSWADFASFGSDSFAASFPGDTSAPPNTCIATPTLSSSGISSQSIIAATEIAVDTPAPLENSIGVVEEKVPPVEPEPLESSDQPTPVASSLEHSADGEKTISHSINDADKTGLDASEGSIS